MHRIFFILSILFFGYINGQAQKAGQLLIDPSANGKGLVDYLNAIENNYDIDFIYDSDKLNPVTISGIREEQYLINFLEKGFRNFTAIKLNDQMVIVTDRDTGYEFGKRKDNYLILASSDNSIAQISGIIYDASTDKGLLAVQVAIAAKSRGAVTDQNGYYEFKVPESVFRLDIKYVGYETISYVVGFSSFSEKKDLSVALRPSLSELEGVVVTANQVNDNVEGWLSGVENLSISTIKELPTFMGEVDPIKGLITLPGISTVGEISSGFNVRGGDTGQNLIIQDGATIYNPSHLFGFYSAFNPDLISSVSLYKGGGSADYGGRIASVMEVNLKNGNSALHKVKGGVGMTSSRLAIEGPIAKGKLSYNVGGRISYTDWLLRASNNIDLVDNSAKFYDLTGKVFYDLNKYNSITTTGYHSYDNFKLDNDSTFSWSTSNLTVNWDHIFKSGMVSILTLANSNYDSHVDNQNPLSGFKYDNGIKNWMLKYHLNFEFKEKIEFSAGVEVNHNISSPGMLTPNPESVDVKEIEIDDQNSIEAAMYASANFDFSDRWSITAGLRFSNFFRTGPGRTYLFDYQSLGGRYPTIIDSVDYAANELIQYYNGIEPRVSFRYLINDKTSIKASYYRSFQYLHLVSNTATTAPVDYWIASGPYILPEIGDQFSLGVFKNLSQNNYELSVEGFYKHIQNPIDYIEGANTTLNKSLESGLIPGTGMAYGIELMVKKNMGKFTGWFSYTYSRSLRAYNDSLEIKTVNNGEYYASLHDQPNNLSLVFNYSFNEQLTLSSNFSYSTGRPITIPISKFSYDGYLSVLNYSNRNEYRMPDYHRLDISLTLKDRPKSNQRFFGEWVLSVYNIYGRKNAYSIYFDKYGKAHKISVLGTVFPSLTYNFKF